MDFLRSGETASANCLKKPTFQMSCLIVSRCEASATPDPCETSICDVELSDSMALKVREGCPPVKKGR